MVQRRIILPMSYSPILSTPFVGEYHVNGVLTPGSFLWRWFVSHRPMQVSIHLFGENKYPFQKCKGHKARLLLFNVVKGR